MHLPLKGRAILCTGQLRQGSGILVFKGWHSFMCAQLTLRFRLVYFLKRRAGKHDAAAAKV